jgi:hypothetical protein
MVWIVYLWPWSSLSFGGMISTMPCKIDVATIWAYLNIFAKFLPQRVKDMGIHNIRWMLGILVAWVWVNFLPTLSVATFYSVE